LAQGRQQVQRARIFAGCQCRIGGKQADVAALGIVLRILPERGVKVRIRQIGFALALA
jgi:hypothetical protein